MRSVSVIKRPISQLFLTVLLLSGLVADAQENSPYSRYGWGNLVPGTPVATRGMGGITTGFVDYDPRFDLKLRYPKPQTLNTFNPASYGKLRITSFDLGFQVDNQSLRQQDRTGRSPHQSSTARCQCVHSPARAGAPSRLAPWGRRRSRPARRCAAGLSPAGGLTPPAGRSGWWAAPAC